MSERRRVYIRVSGRVQGVGFRYFTQRQARALGLVGYVQNREDGSVELEVEGAADGVMALIEAVRQGPPGASVYEVETDVQPAGGTDSEFEIRF